MVAWEHLKPQLTEFIADLHSRGWTDAEIMDKLSNEYWVTEAPFKGEVFNYESARFTLQQLCNMYEMLTGSDETFVKALNLNIRSLLNVDYEQDAATAEAQREYVWSLNRVIDRESGAA